MTGHKWCGRPGSRHVPIRAPGSARARPLLRCLPAAPLHWRQVERKTLKRAAVPHMFPAAAPPDGTRALPNRRR
eukprot:scaffold106749_cov26-Phaeocystis_antarctica.AAC.1